MEAIIFDVDGTLWDSTEQVMEAWNQVLGAWPGMSARVTSGWLSEEFGQPMDVIIKHLTPDMEQGERDRLALRLFERENERVAQEECLVYDGVAEDIPCLSKDYKLFIVSNCQAGYIEAFLKNTGLGSYITDHVCPDDTGLMKAGNIRFIMEKHKIERAVYVGDTQGDADACREAGIPMVYVSYGFGEVQNPEYTIDSFGKLKDLMWKIKKQT